MRYSAIDKGRETNSGKKTDGHTEVHPDDSPLGEPGAEKLHAGIYWGRASQGARLPTIKSDSNIDSIMLLSGDQAGWLALLPWQFHYFRKMPW